MKENKKKNKIKLIEKKIKIYTFSKNIQKYFNILNFYQIKKIIKYKT